MCWGSSADAQASPPGSGYPCPLRQAAVGGVLRPRSWGSRRSGPFCRSPPPTHTHRAPGLQGLRTQVGACANTLEHAGPRLRSRPQGTWPAGVLPRGPWLPPEGSLLPLSRRAVWRGHRWPQAAASVPVWGALAAGRPRSRRARPLCRKRRRVCGGRRPVPAPLSLRGSSGGPLSAPATWPHVAHPIVQSNGSDVTSSASASGGLVFSRARLPARCRQVGVARWSCWGRGGGGQGEPWAQAGPEAGRGRVLSVGQGLSER